ncbi:MAG: Crp/Fnr family transcriptional regulator [Planctomycetaceae bacterium]|nr:Crp/Fnr family transcriptional regulator [Planctomycetaceae bacterium]
MAQPDVMQRLREIPFSARLPEKALTDLAAIAEIRSVPGGARLFREGEPHCCIYLLISGSIVLEMHVPGRGKVQILTIGPGDVLGWSPVVSDTVMTATATTLEDTELIEIQAGALLQLCESDREVGYFLMQQMAAALSRRLVATRLQLLDLFAETTPQQPSPL